ncbi:MAG: hypothetical protein ACTSU5_18765, partial [Promethearchaeota archaeon]
TATKEAVSIGASVTKKLVTKGLKAEVKEPGPIVSQMTVPEKISRWIQLDQKAMREIDSVEVLDDNHLRVNFDLDSEGFVARVDLELETREVEGKTLVLGTFSSPLGFNYIYDIAIGRPPGFKRTVAVSLPTTSTNSIDEVLGELRSVDVKDQSSWDRAMIALNNDKSVIKNVDKLELVAPAPEMPDVLVPVIINHQGGAYVLNVTTYVTPTLKPYFILNDVVDNIAATLDYLGDMDAEAQGGTLEAGLGPIGGDTFQQRDFTFHYLPKDDKVKVKLCPHCGRPLDPTAEYRRCPHCFQKLDTSF